MLRIICKFQSEYGRKLVTGVWFQLTFYSSRIIRVNVRGLWICPDPEMKSL